MTETGAEFVPVVFLTSVDAWSPGDRAELSAAMTQGLIKGGSLGMTTVHMSAASCRTVPTG
jgi:hypothetical protein